MKYVIDTNNLIEMIKKLQVRYHNTLDLIPETEIAEYLVNDKKPIEEVASGHVYLGGDYNVVGSVYVDSIANPYKGKNIKIYIEEL